MKSANIGHHGGKVGRTVSSSDQEGVGSNPAFTSLILLSETAFLLSSMSDLNKAFF